MRRKEREKDKTFALSVVDGCKYAFLSVIDPDGNPYGVPLTVVRDGEYIYFHCAREGFKINCFQNNPYACMVCVTDAETVGREYTVKYKSAIIRGQLSEVTAEEEKIRVLRLLCLRHVPDYMGMFDAEVNRFFNQTAVWKMSIDSITGKSNY